MAINIVRSVLLQNTPILCYNIQKRSAYAVFWQNISKCGRKEEQVQRERRQRRISRVFVCLKRAFKKERKGSACSIRSPRSQSLSQITTLSSSKAFCDIFGRQKIIAIQPSLLASAFEGGIPIDASRIMGFEKEADSELFLVPDTSTMSLLPWRPAHGRVVRFFCDIRRSDGTRLRHRLPRHPEKSG